MCSTHGVLTVNPKATGTMAATAARRATGFMLNERERERVDDFSEKLKRGAGNEKTNDTVGVRIYTYFFPGMEGRYNIFGYNDGKRRLRVKPSRAFVG